MNRLGYGIKQDWNSLSADGLLAAVAKALGDPIMRQNVEKVRASFEYEVLKLILKRGKLCHSCVIGAS